MSSLKIGDRVVRRDGANHCIGVITATGQETTKGNTGYLVSGVGWENSTWTEGFIIKHEFELGDIVLPRDDEKNHGIPGRVAFIENNGNMGVISAVISKREAWSGTYTPDYLQLIDKGHNVRKDEALTGSTVDLYLSY